MLDKRLQLTPQQQMAFANLADALQKCEDLDISFAYNWQNTLYAWNGNEVSQVFFREDMGKDFQIIPLNDLPQLSFEPLELCSEDDGFNVAFKD